MLRICDLCMTSLESPTLVAVLELGWRRIQEHDPIDSTYGWKCPACASGAPPKVRRRSRK